MSSEFRTGRCHSSGTTIVLSRKKTGSPSIEKRAVFGGGSCRLFSKPRRNGDGHRGSYPWEAGTGLVRAPWFSPSVTVKTMGGVIPAVEGQGALRASETPSLREPENLAFSSRGNLSPGLRLPAIPGFTDRIRPACRSGHGFPRENYTSAAPANREIWT